MNGTSGVRTPFGGVITGVILILTCAFLSPHLAFIPTASLSAVIIFSMFFTIDYSMPRMLWRSNSKNIVTYIFQSCSGIDLIPYSLTFFLGLFWNVESGLIVGCLVHVCLLLYSQSKPLVLVQPLTTHTLVRPQASLAFPGVEHLRRRLAEATETSGSKPLVLDLGLVQTVDFTVAKALSGLVQGLRSKGAVVEICCVRPEVLATLQPVFGESLEVSDSVEEALNVTLV